jgi:hypothetical protein
MNRTVTLHILSKPLMAQDYDKIFKENIESIYLTLSEKVLHFKPQIVENVTLDIQRTLERKPDFLKKVQHPETEEIFLLHIEIQSSDESEMLYRMYEYRALMFRKFKINIRQMVIYVGEGISKMKNTIEDGLNKFHYDLYSIQSIPYYKFIESANPEELLLAILGNFENDSIDIVLEKMFQRAKKVVNETFSIEKFVIQLEAFAQFRNYFEPYKLILNKVMPIEFKRGEKLGEKKNRDNMILALIKKGKMSLEDIAEVAQVDIEYVKEISKKIK